MLTVNQVLADARKMKRFICERIPADATTEIILADGGDGPLWAELLPIRDDDGDCDLLIETNEPDAVGLRDVYDHFRRQERTAWEWEREMAADMNRWKVHDLENEMNRLRESSMAASSSPHENRNLAEKTTLTASETAAFLGCSYGEARKRMLEGRIRTMKDGRWLRTRPEWIEDYVNKITIRPADNARENLAIPVPSRRRKTNASVKVGGIGHLFLKKRAK